MYQSILKACDVTLNMVLKKSSLVWYNKSAYTYIFSFCASFCDQVQVYKLCTKVCYDVNTGASVPAYLFDTYRKLKTSGHYKCMHNHTHTHSQHSSHSRISTSNNILCLLLMIIVVLKKRLLRRR